MKIDISPELAERIQHLVDCGKYESTDHALEGAVHLLEEYEKEHEFELSIVRGMVQQATEDMEKGNYSVHTDENLHELFDEIKREGRLCTKWRKEREEHERQQILQEASGD